jgi:hypothetical protein
MDTFGVRIRPDVSDASSEEHPAQGSIVTNDDGLQELVVNDEVTIELGDNTKIFVSSADMDSVFDLYENAGRIINREKRAYYDGVFAKNKDGEVDHLVNGVWRDINDNNIVGFENELVPELWYTYDEGNGAYFCYFARALPEYLNQNPTGYILDIAFMIQDGERYELLADDVGQTYWGMIQYGVRYEVRELFGELYVVSDNLEDYAKGRTVRVGDIDGICYKIVPEGKEKNMCFLFEQFELELKENNDIEFVYELYVPLDGYLFSGQYENEQKKRIWKK